METNNKLREALELFVEYSELVCRMGMFNRNSLIKLTTKAKAALAEPVKNCEVGTASEQYKRWLAFCRRYDATCSGCSFDEPLDSIAHCFAKWDQRPYEEGGAR